MKKILVPTDFSPAARTAGDYAAELAKAFEAELYLLHAYIEPAPVTEAPVAWVIIGSELQEEYDARIHQEMNRLKERYGVAVHGTARQGYEGSTIREMADEVEADLMVMGLKGDKRNRLPGSTTLTMIRKTKTPVLVVHEGIAFTPIRHVALAVDFNVVTAAASFNPLFELLERFDADLHVLHVEKINADIEPSELVAKLNLDRVLSRVSFWYEKLVNNDVERGIKNFVQNHPVDLLVMVRHHHSIVERLFGEVHTSDMIYETNRPVLILKDR